MIKTRMQKQKALLDGTLLYKSFFDCARQVATKEGPGAFYKGLSTYIVRIGPHAFITLLAFDAVNASIGQWVRNLAR